MLLVDRIDTSKDLRLASLVDVLRTVSAEHDPPKVIAAFGPWLSSRVQRDYFVSLSRRNLRPGEYKITRSFPTPQATGIVNPSEAPKPSLGQTPSGDIPDPWRDWKSLRAHTGGLIGEILEGDAPQTMRVQGLEHDPVLGPTLGELAGQIRAVLAMPTFDHGESLNWSLAFSTNPNAFPLEIIENAFLDLNMIGTATRNLVALKQVEELNKQLEGQFEQIARIQQSLLPKRLPKIPNFGLAASYLTSTVAGGDYYDFFPFPDGRWGVLIADVAGHGPGAATVMAMLRAILHCYETNDPSPATMLSYANEKLFDAKLEGTFVTAFLGLIDVSTGGMVWASCGHTPTRVKRGADGSIEVLNDVGSLPLGVMLGEDIEEARFTFKPNDTLVLYTDGISEAFNSNREMFGVAGIDRALKECSGAPHCAVDSIHEGIYRHAGGLQRDDDQTLVVMQFTPEDIQQPGIPGSAAGSPSGSRRS